MSNSNAGLEIRKLKPNDDIYKVAELIHQTDSLIYPFLCSNYKDKEWIKLIHSCLTDEQNLFYTENITVLIFNGEIIGLINLVPCGVQHTFATGEITEKEVYKEYFEPLIKEIEELDGYYLCNICVSEQYRGHGLGHIFLSNVLTNLNCRIHTDAVSNNLPAIKIYNKNGFTSTGMYAGYSGADKDGVKCTKLLREKTALTEVTCPSCKGTFICNEAGIPYGHKYDVKCPYCRYTVLRKRIR